MTRRYWLDKWWLTKLTFNAGYLNAEFATSDPDRAAAWDLYIELLTRISTQSPPPNDGDEKNALDSVHAIFPLTREIIRKHGSGCGEFAKFAILFLNQVIRPFTAKWHRLSLVEGFQSSSYCKEFRAELAELQQHLQKYAQTLATMAGVEDLTYPMNS